MTNKYDPFGNLTVEEWMKNLNNAFAEAGKTLESLRSGVSFVQTGEAQPDVSGVLTTYLPDAEYLNDLRLEQAVEIGKLRRKLHKHKETIKTARKVKALKQEVKRLKRELSERPMKPFSEAERIYHAALAEFASGSNWVQWRDDDGEPQAFQWTGDVNPIELARQAILKVKDGGEK